jgi:uncharacterized repeat protein (TIGR01451 family)
MAVIGHADQFDPNGANNSAAVEVIAQQSDLALSQTVDNPRPNVGDIVTFTVTVRNTGPNAADNVQVGDMLPAGLELVSAAPGQGSYNSSTGVWAVGTLGNGASSVLTIRGRVISGSAETNTATIIHADQFDPDASNDSASATETPRQVDLALASTVSDAVPNVGDTITFTIILTNTSAESATDVAVQDSLPPGLSLESATATQGTYDAASGTWSVGTVAPSNAVKLTIMARVISPEPQTNTAIIGHADQSDPNPANNTTSVTETPQRADLALTMSLDDSSPSLGDIITFVVTTTNRGPDAATGVEVTDLLPDGLRFVSSMASQGGYTASTGLWNVGTLPSGGSATLRLQARVISLEPQTNTATIAHVDQFDPFTTNNEASAIEEPVADLAVAQTVGPGLFMVGQEITYTLVVTNHGPSIEPFISLVDVLPAGVTFVSASVASVSRSAGTLNFQLGPLAVGGSALVTVVVRVDESGTLVNQAAVSGSLPDPVLSNDTASLALHIMSDAPTVVSLERLGFHAQPTLLVLRFSEPLDAVPAQDLRNYHLMLIADGGRQHRSIRLTSAVYNAAAHTVTLHSAPLLPLRFQYKLVVDGSSPTGVSDSTGVMLDGAANGVPGSDYVRVFGREILAGPNPLSRRQAQTHAHRLRRSQARPVTLIPRAVHAGSTGIQHRAPGSSVTRLTGIGLRPSMVDSALEAIVHSRVSKSGSREPRGPVLIAESAHAHCSKLPAPISRGGEIDPWHN